MKGFGRSEIDVIQEENDAVSLCSLYAGSEIFGIDTRKIREVLGQREPQRVPMSPPFVAGVVPYRGEVLTAVNLRALLGMEEHTGGCVLVMEDEAAAERFGLVVDAVGGVVTVSERSFEANPCTLEARGR
jgi:purine-binding chemotaxis protein CheW